MVENKAADGTAFGGGVEYNSGTSAQYDLYEWKMSESGGMLGMRYGHLYDWRKYLYPRL